MNLTVQKQIDFTSILIKGLSELKKEGVINFDYYSIKEFNIGGNEIMLVDEVCQLVMTLKSALKEKIDILLISDVSEDSTEFYFYLRNFKFTEDVFTAVYEKKPLYTYLLQFESNWEKYGVSISTFNVSDSVDSCLSIKFDLKERSM